MWSSVELAKLITNPSEMSRRRITRISSRYGRTRNPRERSARAGTLHIWVEMRQALLRPNGGTWNSQYLLTKEP